MYGCAVYTGRDTKMSMNSKLGSNKFSTVEKSMNKVILVYIGLLVAEVVLCSSLRYAFSFDLQYDSFEAGKPITDHWYLGNYFSRKAINVIQDIFSFLVIFNNIVPISLYVTLEVQKFVGRKFAHVFANRFSNLVFLQALSSWSGTETSTTR